MRHQKRKFLKFKNKDQSHRDSMLRNLVTSIFTHKSLITTEKRARAIIPMVDKLIHGAQGDNKRLRRQWSVDLLALLVSLRSSIVMVIAQNLLKLNSYHNFLCKKHL